MTAQQGVQPWTILKVINWSTEYLSSKGVENARLDAQLLLGHTLKLTKVELYTAFDKPLSKDELTEFKANLVRRANREPLAYIVGTKGFWKHDFIVSKDTLIPRPDTEALLEKAIDTLKSSHQLKPNILDIGTGTGCLAISLALEFTDAEIDAVDTSAEALKIATQNALNLQAKVHFIQSDLFSALKGKVYNLIVSNPPYISETEKKSLAPEIQLYEPKTALFSEHNGMEHYIRILKDAKTYLAPKGVLLLEIGDHREKDLTEIAKETFLNINIHNDLSGNPRVLELRI